MAIRSVTWGDDFGLKVSRAGGMPKVVARLIDVWGKTAESRGTLDKLRHCHVGPEAMTDLQRWRAYQVLVVIGQDPADWGIDRASLGVPPSLVDQKPTGQRRITPVSFTPLTEGFTSGRAVGGSQTSRAEILRRAA